MDLPLKRRVVVRVTLPRGFEASHLYSPASSFDIRRITNWPSTSTFGVLISFFPGIRTAMNVMRLLALATWQGRDRPTHRQTQLGEHLEFPQTLARRPIGTCFDSRSSPLKYLRAGLGCPSTLQSRVKASPTTPLTDVGAS